MCLAAASVAIAACGGSIPPTPMHGGPTWREVTSEHFVLWTNTWPERARELIREMEDLRQAVVGIGFRGAATTGRSFVIALRDDEEVHAYMPGDFDAMASPATSIVNQPMILLSANSQHDGKLIAAHELTHTISLSVIRDQPRWFGEGLAKYFETIRIDRANAKVDLGHAPVYRGEPLLIRRPVALHVMFACKELSCVTPNFYAAAWAFFTYLTNVYPKELALYEQKLAEGVGHERAWLDVFGGIPLEKLDTEMRQWLASGKHKVFHYNVQQREWQVSERTLADADVHAARAIMRLQFQQRVRDARAEVRAALALEPKHVLATFLSLRIDEFEAKDDAGRVKALRAACDLADENPAVLAPCR